MSDHASFPEDRPIFNVVQIIAANIGASAALFGILTLAGLSGLVALSTAWIGGSLLTGVGAVLALVIHDKRRMRQSGSGVKTESPIGPALVSTQITDPMQVWEADRLLELDYARMTGRIDPTRKPRRASPKQMVHMWEVDADDDLADYVVPKRPERADRRAAELPFIGKERRRS